MKYKYASEYGVWGGVAWGGGEDDDDVDRILKPTESSEPPTLTFLNHYVTHVKGKFSNLNFVSFRNFRKDVLGGNL